MSDFLLRYKHRQVIDGFGQPLDFSFVYVPDPNVPQRPRLERAVLRSLAGSPSDRKDDIVRVFDVSLGRWRSPTAQENL